MSVDGVSLNKTCTTIQGMLVDLERKELAPLEDDLKTAIIEPRRAFLGHTVHDLDKKIAVRDGLWTAISSLKEEQNSRVHSSHSHSNEHMSGTSNPVGFSHVFSRCAFRLTAQSRRLCDLDVSQVPEHILFNHTGYHSSEIVSKIVYVKSSCGSKH
jgi:hypothetical protein